LDDFAWIFGPSFSWVDFALILDDFAWILDGFLASPILVYFWLRVGVDLEGVGAILEGSFGQRQPKTRQNSSLSPGAPVPPGSAQLFAASGAWPWCVTSVPCPLWLEHGT